jgi:hypothetical protein
MKKIRKAVVPMAHYGLRFLPFTKDIGKYANCTCTRTSITSTLKKSMDYGYTIQSDRFDCVSKTIFKNYLSNQN